LKEQLGESGRAFDSQYETGAKFRTHIFTVSIENWRSYVLEIERFLERITQLSDQDQSDHVAQINLQFFSSFQKQLGLVLKTGPGNDRTRF
jgi:primosomal protein N''